MMTFTLHVYICIYMVCVHTHMCICGGVYMHAYGSKITILVLFLRHGSVGSSPIGLCVPEKGSAGRGKE